MSNEIENPQAIETAPAHMPESQEAQTHPVDAIAKQYAEKYGQCPVVLMPDPLAPDEFAQEQSLMHLLEQAVKSYSGNKRLDKPAVARVARWFNDKYGALGQLPGSFH